MCAIAGIAGDRAVNVPVVEAMADIMAHRGPDDAGIWQSPDGRAAFGHRRLSVIDVSSAGHQPMIRGNLALTFNGEIYNYVELKNRLLGEGVQFQTATDTEIILAAYQEWGDKFIGELNGMFAFALYDGDNQRMLCARDRYGEKPFLYCRHEGAFSFASEYKALFCLAGMAADYDQARLFRFLQHPSGALDDASQTLFDNVFQLLPAEYLVLDLQTLEATTARYWQPQIDSSNSNLSQSDAEVAFRELLTDSINIRMRSDVPLGSCLSGGLDSSAIVCIARSLLGDEKPYATFTGRFPDTTADEWIWAKQVCEAADTIAYSATPTVEGFIENLALFVWHNELPVGSSSQYAQWCVFEEAKRQGITVLLDGQGGDELLGGYEQYFGAYLNSLPNDARPKEEPRIRERYPLALPSEGQRLGSSAPEWLRHWVAGLTGKGSDFGFGLTREMCHALSATASTEAPSNIDGSPLTRALQKDTFHAILPVLLRYGDRISMAHSREVRLPFCDHRLAEFVFSLGPSHLMGNIQTKRLLRGAMTDIVPQAIVNRWGKQGFLPPQLDWFQGPLGDRVESIIESEQFQRSGIWRPAWWRAIIKRMRSGDAYAANLLWRPLMEHAWQEHFLSPIESQPKLPLYLAH